MQNGNVRLAAKHVKEVVPPRKESVKGKGCVQVFPNQRGFTNYALEAIKSVPARAAERRGIASQY